ncbi:hypothetical protein [Nocardioides sp. R-C-SC26]|uniref:hypothetical protein n=1 Tax=Nocardioides sp. R-C-SC26 TaxID=2870414 RepID=UPI001E44BD7C|nr:hypothetical protein [Nocardioides sp. R-C-SC26]
MSKLSRITARLRSTSGQAPAQESAVEEPTTQAQADRERRRGMNLTELALDFGTDKAGDHHYTQHYQRHLEHLRGEAFTLLEIGIGGYKNRKNGGQSLRMWKWFFPKAQIVGLDIEDKSWVEAGRIKVYQGSQDDEAVLERIVAEQGPIKVVIDDGSHRPEHIRETFRILFPLLADDGIYCIEDTQTSYWPEFGGSADRQDPTTTMALVKDLIDGLHFEEFVDEDYTPKYTDQHITGISCYHNLVVIQKGDNVEGTNKHWVLKERYGGAPTVGPHAPGGAQADL